MIFLNFCATTILFTIIFLFIYSSNNKNNNVNISLNYNNSLSNERTSNNKILVIIAFSKFTTSQLNRFKSIGEKLPSNYEIGFQTENCEYINILKPFKVFCFTKSDFKREFPSCRNMSGACHNQQPWFYMWSMWLESVLHSIKSIYLQYKFIWVMEGDVGYSGDINSFFKRYDNNIYSDLLSLPRIIFRSVNEWCWYDCYTYEYMEWIKSKTPTDRLFAAINIFRLSPNLINFVMENIKLNRHSHCESTLHETAKYNNLKVSYINDSDLGKEIGVGDRVSEYKWKLYNSDPLKQNKLYHALKF